jgi:hypothetical protein
MKNSKKIQKEEIIKMLDGMNAHALSITHEKVNQVNNFYRSWMDTKVTDSEVISNGMIVFDETHNFTNLISSRPCNRKKK